jgi:hypothetical protein
MATRFVRCIDNTLADDVLSVGEIYEVMHINERDGYYALSGLGQFTMAPSNSFRCDFRLLLTQSGRRCSSAPSPPKNTDKHRQRAPAGYSVK